MSKNLFNLNNPYDLPVIIGGDIDYDTSDFINPWFMQYRLDELKPLLAPRLLWYGSMVANNPLQQLEKLFIEAKDGSKGWIIKIDANQIWFVNAESSMIHQNKIHCIDALYKKYKSFLIKENQFLHYVIKDKSRDIVTLFHSYQSLMTRLYPVVDSAANVELKKCFPSVINGKLWIAYDQKNRRVIAQYSDNEPVTYPIKHWLLKREASSFFDTIVNDLGNQRDRMPNSLGFLSQIISNKKILSSGIFFMKIVGTIQQAFQNCPASISMSNKDLLVDGVRMSIFNPSGVPISAKVIGDFNGDGKNDLLFNMPIKEGVEEYEYYCVILTQESWGYPLRWLFHPSDMNGSNGFCVKLPKRVISKFPSVITTDFNNDGLTDLVIGVGIESGKPEKRYSGILYGKKSPMPPIIEYIDFEKLADKKLLTLIDGVTILGRADVTPGKIGDVNGDGIKDVFFIVSYGGKKCIIFGSKAFQRIIDIRQLTAGKGFCFTTSDIPKNGQLFYLFYVGDVNGDNIDDLGLGYAPSIRAYKRLFQVIFGSKNLTSTIFDLDTLNGKNGYTLLESVTVNSAAYSGTKQPIRIFQKTYNDIIITGGGQPGTSAYILRGSNVTHQPIEQLNEKAAVKLSTDSGVGDEVDNLGAIGKDDKEWFILAGKDKNFVIPSQDFPSIFSLDTVSGANGFIINYPSNTGVLMGNGGGQGFNPNGGSVVISNFHTDGITDITILYDCHSKNIHYFSNVLVLGLKADQYIKIVTWEDNKKYYLSTFFVDIINGEHRARPPFYYLEESRGARQYAYHPMITHQDEKHFLLFVDKVHNSTQTIINSIQFTYSTDSVGEETVIKTNDHLKASAVINDKGTVYISAKSDDTTYINKVGNFPNKMLSVPSKSPHDATMKAVSVQLPTGERVNLVSYFSGERAAVYAHSQLPTVMHPEFRLNALEWASSSYYLLRAREKSGQFAYVTFKATDEAGLLYHLYKLSIDTKTAKLVSSKQLLDLQATTPFSVVQHDDGSFSVFYQKNNQWITQLFSIDAISLGSSNAISATALVEGKMLVTSLDNRYSLIGHYERLTDQLKYMLTIDKRSTLFVATLPTLRYLTYENIHYNLLLNQTIQTTLNEGKKSPDCYLNNQVAGLFLNKTSCILYGYAPSWPGNYALNMSIYDGESWVNSTLHLDVLARPPQLAPLYIVLGLGTCSIFLCCTGVLVCLGILGGIQTRRVLKRRNAHAEYLQLKYKDNTNEVMSYYSVLDKNKQVNISQVVISLVYNDKKKQFIFILESIHNGNIRIEKFLLKRRVSHVKLKKSFCFIDSSDACTFDLIHNNPIIYFSMYVLKNEHRSRCFSSIITNEQAEDFRKKINVDRSHYQCSSVPYLDAEDKNSKGQNNYTWTKGYLETFYFLTSLNDAFMKVDCVGNRNDININIIENNEIDNSIECQFEELLENAESCLRKDNYSGAENLINKALMINPDHHDANVLLLNILRQQAADYKEFDISDLIFRLEKNQINVKKLTIYENKNNESIKLGEGGSGEVVQGLLEKNKISYASAIKLINTSELENQEINNLLREPAIMYYLQGSPWILPCYGINIKESRLLIVTELLSQGSLEQYLKKYPNLTIKEKAKIISRIAHALQFIHLKYILHRDINPANILIDENGSVKLGDFGLACHISEVKKIRKAGTEIFSDQAYWNDECYYNFPCDVYSFGMLLYYILSNGGEIVNIETKTDLQQFMADKKYKKIKTDCPIKLFNLMKKCLRKDPEKRPTAEKIVYRIDKNKKAIEEWQPDFFKIHVDKENEVPDNLNEYEMNDFDINECEKSLLN